MTSLLPGKINFSLKFYLYYQKINSETKNLIFYGWNPQICFILMKRD